MKPQADIGVVGLAVMGENLILNMESRGFTVACYNRTIEKVDAFVGGRGKGKNLIGCRSIPDFVAALDLVNQIGHEAEQRNHHPDIDIRWNTVTLVLSTHSEGGLTHKDLELARQINELMGL